MKKTKVLLSLACAVMLVVTSVMGTMAYLTATDKVENTFTVGNVTLNNEYGHGLDEAPVDANGQATTGDRVQANSYKLMPGHEYDKDPTVHVYQNSDDCYIFVTVDNGIANIEDSSNKIASQMSTNNWKPVDGYTNLYIYATGNDAKTAVSAGTTGKDLVVFSKFKVAGTVTNDTLKTYANAKIVVNAYAVQKDGFESKSASEIWTATFGAPTT